MSAAPYGPLLAVREDRGRFARLRDRRVLIYWPHGLGDWVHFGSIAPLLEPSNRFAITRFGDDYVAMMEGNALVAPLLSGVREPGDGSELGAPHMGVRLKDCSGKALRLQLAPPLLDALESFAPDTLLWTDYPETEGRTAYPFHTKARNLARLLVRAERLAEFDLAKPLPSSIDFAADAEIQKKVDARLSALMPADAKLCAISRAGVTAARKNWGDGSEAREFAAALRGEDRRWRFVSMDGEPLGDAAAGFRELFGDIDEPFARVLRAFSNRVDLFVGTPAGPLHFMMARGGVPIVGLWIAHHPDWYDEPNPAAIHLVGRYVRDRKFDRRPATLTKPPSLRHRLHYLDTLGIGSGDVFAAARAVIA